MATGRGEQIMKSSSSDIITRGLKSTTSKKSKSFILIPHPFTEKLKLTTALSTEDILINLKSSSPQLRLLALRNVRSCCDGSLYRAAAAEMPDLLRNFWENAQLLCEACKLLRGIASQCCSSDEDLISFIPLLKELLEHESMEVRTNAVLALGSIALMANSAREALITQNVPELLSQCCLDSNTPPLLLRQAIRTLSYITSSDAPLPDKVVLLLIPLLRQLLHHPNDEILTYLCIILFYLTDVVNERLQEVIDAGVVPRLTELLGSFNINVARYTLYTLYNLVSGNPTQAKVVLDCDILPSIRKFLYRPVLQKDALDMVSNILFSNYVQKVLNSGIVKSILEVAGSKDFDKKALAIIALRNIAISSSPDQIIQAVNIGVLENLCGFLLNSDPRVQRLALDAIRTYFEAARGQTPLLCGLLQSYGALDRLHLLAKRRAVKDLARPFLERYFNLIQY